MSKYGYVRCTGCNKNLLRTKKKIEKGALVRISDFMRVGKGKKFNKIAEIECSCGGISFKLVRD